MKIILSYIILFLTALAGYGIGSLSSKIGYGVHTWQYWLIAIPISLCVGYCGGQLVADIANINK